MQVVHMKKLKKKKKKQRKIKRKGHYYVKVNSEHSPKMKKKIEMKNYQNMKHYRNCLLIPFL